MYCPNCAKPLQVDEVKPEIHGEGYQREIRCPYECGECGSRAIIVSNPKPLTERTA